MEHKKTVFKQTVSGVFENETVANKAISDLVNEGFTKNEISLLMSDKTRNTMFGDKYSSSEVMDRTAKGAASGAAIGGVLGAIIAGLTVVGSIVTTGGALLVSGPIVAILSGGGAGAVAGGLAGGLVRAGFAVDEANRYEAEIEQGKAVVIVHTNDDLKASRARSILKNSGAILKAA